MLYSLGTIKAVNRNDRFTSIRDIAPCLKCAKSGHSSTQAAVRDPLPNGPTLADLRWVAFGQEGCRQDILNCR
jgi:hypothetical protein